MLFHYLLWFPFSLILIFFVSNLNSFQNEINAKKKKIIKVIKTIFHLYLLSPIKEIEKRLIGKKIDT